MMKTELGRFIIALVGIAIVIFVPYLVGHLMVDDVRIPWYGIWCLGVVGVALGYIAFLLVVAILIKLYIFIKHGE